MVLILQNEFGVEPESLEGPSDLIASLGPGVGASDFAITYPTFGAWYPDVRDIEKILPCTVTGYSRPRSARDLPRAVWHDKSDRGEHWIIYWSEPVQHDDGEMKSRIFVNCKTHGHEAAEEIAWSYFHTRYD